MTSPQRPTDGATDPPAPAADPAWSMSLINNLMRTPLDPGYQAAADRRAAAGKPASTGLRSPLLIVTLVVIGACLAVAAHALRVPQAATDSRRTELIGGIRARQHDIAADSRTIDTTRRQISRLQEAALTRQHDTSLAKRLTTLELTTGSAPAHGPGLVLTVNDAAGAGTDAQGNPRTDTSDTGRLTSTDLQIVVNGLWEAGAEAVSINGQRLTTQTAIRFAGQAILVNFRALSPPYAISVIGGPGVADSFRADSGGAYLRALVSDYGIREDLATKDAVDLPAAVTAPLAHASVQPAPSTSRGGS
ncbi:DUF881 domain-containing protein [Flexivirga caeni]|uniref:DUF881 domain-containing protein n=1 Tax=Flexivirga caeni TaxID=2294115 RepID=A0A3M9MB61_9MICO|nr:DUF881 domain-containing protein [Flexivirga caeni]RNI22810.1 DUF881 domain-containing protein [Flexivirga caeni]